MKRILSLFLLSISFLYISSVHTTYALTLKEKIEIAKKKNMKTQTSKKEIIAIKDVTVEVKIETEKGEDPESLKAKLIWRSEKKKTYGIKFFSTEGYLTSFSKKVPRDDLYGQLELLPNTAGDGEYTMNQKVVIPLNYNKFNGTVTERRELIYIVVKYDIENDYYTYVKHYTQDEKNKEEEVLKNKVFSYKGKTRPGYNDITLQLTDPKTGEVYLSDKTNVTGEFNLEIEEEDIEFNKEYNLIYGKEGDLEKGVPGILFEGKKLKFKNLKDLDQQLNEDVILRVKLNNKDIVKKEKFPYLFAIVLFVVYIVFCLIVYIRIVRKVWSHSLKKRQAKVIFEGRRKKILSLKEKIGKQ